MGSATAQVSPCDFTLSVNGTTLDGNQGRRGKSKLLQLFVLSSDFAEATATVGRPEGTGFIKTDQPYCGNARVTDSWVKVKFTLEQATQAQRGEEV